MGSLLNRITVVLALVFIPSCRGCAGGAPPSPPFFLSKQPVKPASAPLAKASEDARPPWAPMMGGYADGYAPQAGARAELWKQAMPSGAVLSPEKGLLICKVKYDQQTDPQAAWKSAKEPDLSLAIDVAGGGELRAWGADDSRSAWFSVPQPELTQGAVLQVHFYDRNWGNNADEQLGSLAATWNGTVPLSVNDGLRSLTCSWVDPAYVAQLAEDAAREAAHELTKVSAKPLNHPLVPGCESNATWWNLLMDDADRHIASLAGLTGWAHPRVKELVAERAAVSAAKRAAGQKLVAEKRASLTPGAPVRGHEFEVRATGVDCAKGPDANDDPGCKIVLDVVGLDKKLEISNPLGISGTRCVVLLADGGAIDNEKLAWEVRKGNQLGNEHWWQGQAEKGEHVVIAVSTKPALRQTGPQPALFLLVGKQGPLVVRLP